MVVRPNYAIYAPSYNGNSGGIIFLHRLAETLQEIGESVCFIPWRHGIRNRALNMIRRRKFVLAPGVDIPVAAIGDLNEDTIVVYPEIVSGNPLGAKNVARWIMYKPGLLNGPTEFDKDEIFFASSDFSDDVSITGGAQRLVLYLVNPVYRDFGQKKRSGTCYMLRKGHDRPLVHDLNGSRQVDSLSHQELVQVFNECEVFICYDDATMYSQYAAICGCLSIVIPWHYENREDWIRARPIARYGVAYGFDDIDHALQTRHQVHDYLQEMEQEGIQTVVQFVAATKKHFA